MSEDADRLSRLVAESVSHARAGEKILAVTKLIGLQMGLAGEACELEPWLAPEIGALIDELERASETAVRTVQALSARWDSRWDNETKGSG